MSDKDLARRSSWTVAFDGTDITKDLKPYRLTMTYIDNEEDETDDLQIKIQDRDDVWLGKWLSSMVEAAAKTSSPAKIDVSGYRTVYFGHSGQMVRTLQEDLLKLGYKLPKWGADGYFGSETKAAVVAFQKNHSLDPDGSCGPLTWTAILTALAGSSASSQKSGLKIRATITRYNWADDGKDETLKCGEFELDTIEPSGPPSVITIKAASLPYSSQIWQTKKSRAWESYKLSGIANEMARRAGLGCMFLAKKDPEYSRAEQYKESDIAFLSRLCHRAGISLKATGGRLILFDQAAFEGKDAVLNIDRKGTKYGKYRLRVGKTDTEYASCRVSYTDPATGRCIEGVATAENYKESSPSNQQLEIYTAVSSVAEAQELAAKYLRMKNKLAKTATFTLPGNPKLVAGVTVTLSGWGPWNGKYICKQAKHTISDDGYTTDVTFRQVLPEEKTAAAPAAKSYKVGDIVQWKGGPHYYWSGATNSSGSPPAGPAKITASNPGSKHPWHLIHTDSSTWVYGWVDETNFT